MFSVLYYKLIYKTSTAIIINIIFKPHKSSFASQYVPGTSYTDIIN